MCIICVSAAGAAQPSEAKLRCMFQNNPDGAGYMVARNGRVEISKGFMSWAPFIKAIHYEKFTPEDAVVYHFRISTQAGVNPEMTHPFPLTSHIEQCKMLDVSCPVGVAHNGIIPLTSNHRDREYSDTAHYVAEFLRFFVRSPADLKDPEVLDAIRRTTSSKWAIMDGSGYIATVGDFIEDRGNLYSNGSFKAITGYRAPTRNYSVLRGFFEDDAVDY